MPFKYVWIYSVSSSIEKTLLYLAAFRIVLWIISIAIKIYSGIIFERDILIINCIANEFKNISSIVQNKKDTNSTAFYTRQRSKSEFNLAVISIYPFPYSCVQKSEHCITLSLQLKTTKASQYCFIWEKPIWYKSWQAHCIKHRDLTSTLWKQISLWTWLLNRSTWAL